MVNGIKNNNNFSNVSIIITETNHQVVKPKLELTTQSHIQKEELNEEIRSDDLTKKHFAEEQNKLKYPTL